MRSERFVVGLKGKKILEAWRNSLPEGKMWSLTETCVQEHRCQQGATTGLKEVTKYPRQQIQNGSLYFHSLFLSQAEKAFLNGSMSISISVVR